MQTKLRYHVKNEKGCVCKHEDTFKEVLALERWMDVSDARRVGGTGTSSWRIGSGKADKLELGLRR